MRETFFATLSPMLVLFLCILVGFLIKKYKILPENAGKVMAKLETWVFCPALSFSTMARFFTIKTINLHSTNIVFGVLGVGIAMAIAIPLARLFVKEKCYERGVYQYALAFANFSYIGDPLVLSLFGEEILSYYKLACLPYLLVIYTWGIGVLVPKGEAKNSVWKNILNAPMIAMFIGIVVGLICGAVVQDVPLSSTAYDVLFPAFVVKTMDSLKNCMGPVAMLVAGFTIGSYDFKALLKNKKVYLATALRLIIIPILTLAILFGVKELVNMIFHLNIDNTPLILLFFAVATPLGLNTVVFPEAYGGNPETGASMAMISHTLCVITIPLIYALALYVFGGNTWLPI